MENYREIPECLRYMQYLNFQKTWIPNTNNIEMFFIDFLEKSTLSKLHQTIYSDNKS